MEKRLGIFENTNEIAIQQIGDEDCLLQFGRDRVFLSYEAAYDLAIRLAMFVQKVGDAADPQSPYLN